jgi:magnesium chelatase subunit H
MKITVLYVGTSLLAPLKSAEEQINREFHLDLEVAAYNAGATFNEDEWSSIGRDLQTSPIIFIIHVTDDGNAQLFKSALAGVTDKTVIAFNCMPELMRLTRMGKLDFNALMKSKDPAVSSSPGEPLANQSASGQNLARKLGSWMADTFKPGTRKNSEQQSRSNNHGHYVKLIGKLPTVLKFIPSAGRVRDIKNYLNLFCYFLQPTPNNIRSMVLYAIKHYAADEGTRAGESRNGNKLKRLNIPNPERLPAVGIYHPDAGKLFETFEAFQKWNEKARKRKLEKESTVGLLLMRPQIISDARSHYDTLIRAIESEGLNVIPAISTFMDNREACNKFFVEASPPGKPDSTDARLRRGVNRSIAAPSASQLNSRVSQIISLTGFSFVGGPAMNDSEAAADFLKAVNAPLRSLVSLDIQTIESWEGSKSGINPVQTAMQVAIPELDGATEPFVFGGLKNNSTYPEAIEERCRRIARRLSRWNRLQTKANPDKRLAFILFCFPPNKGNIGTAADLDVMESLFEILKRLKSEGYELCLPEDVNRLRQMILEGNANEFGSLANVAYRMSVDEYRRLCPFVDEIESEWGRAPGTINSNGREVLILGVQFENIFIGIQPTFGYEGDPMRLLMAESGAPHHGFMGLYTFLDNVFCADAVVHVGTHGSLEFMPGKQAGLSTNCWPDRLIGEMPNIYLYSVNNPSEGTIAKRRSYGELISYLTPPIENAGLYKELASMKELLTAYRQATRESEREQLFAAIEEKARQINL